MLAADAPARKSHPVAVVIFGGLVSSTLLDTVLTPVLYWLVGEKPTAVLVNTDLGGTEPRTQEAF